MRVKITDHARSLVGVKYRHQGRTQTGMDCAGLIIDILKLLEVPFPIWENYRREPVQADFLASFRKYLVQKPVKDRLPGDVILFRDGVMTMHCAVYDIVDGNEYIIHAFATRRKVVEELYNKQWREATTWCFAFPGVDD